MRKRFFEKGFAKKDGDEVKRIMISQVTTKMGNNRRFWFKTINKIKSADISVENSLKQILLN